LIAIGGSKVRIGLPAGCPETATPGNVVAEENPKYTCLTFDSTGLAESEKRKYLFPGKKMKEQRLIYYLQ